MAESSASRVLPAWFTYATIWLTGLCLLLLLFVIPQFHEMDMRLGGWLQQGHPLMLHRDLVLIDVPERDEIFPIRKFSCDGVLSSP